VVERRHQATSGSGREQGIPVPPNRIETPLAPLAPRGTLMILRRCSRPTRRHSRRLSSSGPLGRRAAPHTRGSVRGTAYFRESVASRKVGANLYFRAESREAIHRCESASTLLS
jgi:hypothetical protein